MNSKLLLALLLTAPAGFTYAETVAPTEIVDEQTGFYVGGGLSSTSLKIESESSQSGMGFGVYGGYNFTPWLGLELSLYASGDLGENNTDVAAATFSLTPKFTIPLNDVVSLYGKVGISSMAIVIEDDSYWYDEELSGVGLTYGIGISAAITKGLIIRASFDKTSAEVESDSYYNYEVDADLSQFTVGLHYQF